MYTALESITQGHEPMNNSKGCGGIMRIAPIPLYGLSQNRIKDVAALNELAADAAKLTHQHLLGFIPTYAMSHIIYRLATNEFPTKETFNGYVHEAMEQATIKYAYEIESMERLQALLDKALTLACENMSDIEAICQLGEGWVAEETLAIAVYCTSKHFDDLEEALVTAVNHGGDSDSTGAVPVIF